MYAVPEDYPGLQNPVTPLGPGWSYDEWWFRGPGVRAAVPKDGAVTLLPAGGQVTLELACDRYYTVELYGADPNGNVACDSPGPLHADPAGQGFYQEWVAGCALGIADVMDPNDATPENFLWQPQTGDTNAYHTPFRCKVTDSPVDAGTIAFPLQDPVKCDGDKSACTKGAKRMLMLYNEPTNVHIDFPADDRPRYDDTWGYFDGAQDDIFLAVDPPETTTTSTIASSTTTSITMSTSTTTQVASITRATTQPAASSSSATTIAPSSSSSTSTSRTTTKHSTASRLVFYPAPTSTTTTTGASSPSAPPSSTTSHTTTSSFPLFFPAPRPTTGRTTTTSRTSRSSTTTTTTSRKWYIAPTASRSTASASTSRGWYAAPAVTSTPSGIRRLTFQERMALEAAQAEQAGSRDGRLRARLKRALRRGAEEL
ncbi:hypothetical protein JCM11251_000217 [Rhodosporidiobolus azoricus]